MDDNDVYKKPRSELRERYQGGDAEVKPFTIRGRMGRAYYVIYSMGFGTLMQLVLGVFVLMIAATNHELLIGIGGLIVIALSLVTWVLLIIWTIRRANDADLSGWISVLALIPFVYPVFWFIPGTKGPNKYGPAPKRGPLGLAIAIGAILPAIFIAGVLAAIAIPAYQDYTQRAQVGECMAASVGVRQWVATSYQETGRFPDAQAISESGNELPVQSIYCTVEINSDSEQIIMSFRDDSGVGPEIRNGQIYYWFEIGDRSLNGYCGSDTIPGRFLPRSCQKED